MTKLNEQTEPKTRTAVAGRLVSNDACKCADFFEIVASKLDEIAVLAAKEKEYNMAQRFGNTASTLNFTVKMLRESGKPTEVKYKLAKAKKIATGCLPGRHFAYGERNDC